VTTRYVFYNSAHSTLDGSYEGIVHKVRPRVDIPTLDGSPQLEAFCTGVSEASLIRLQCECRYGENSMIQETLFQQEIKHSKSINAALQILITIFGRRMSTLQSPKYDMHRDPDYQQYIGHFQNFHHTLSHDYP
jgi:hypothetical protein